jgi:hypothetical protein
MKVEKKNTTKVRLNVTIEVDVDAYNREYGENKSKREVAEDAKWSAFNIINIAYPEDSGVIVNVVMMN